MKKSALIFFSTFFFSFYPVQANSEVPFWFSLKLLCELKESRYPYQFILDSVFRLKSMRFAQSEDENFRATYSIEKYEDWDPGSRKKVITYFDEIILPSYAKGEDGKLKSLFRLSPGDIDNLYHEFWHAYFEHYHRSHQSLYYFLFKLRAMEVYPGLSQEQAETALEEAMGSFVGGVMAHYHWLNIHKEDIKKLPPGRVPGIADFAKSVGFTGYYYDESGKAIYLDQVSLPLPERQFIFQMIFEGKFGKLE